MEQFIEGCFSWPSYPATIQFLLVCGYWCLVIVVDASDFGGGAALLLVRRQCASKVDPLTDFKPENGARLLDMDHKVWSKAEAKYQTYEQELKMIVKYITKRNKFLSKALMDVHYQGSVHLKLGVFTDSTTAMSKWKTVTSQRTSRK